MRRLWEWLAHDWKLRLAAVGVALLLWSMVKAEELVTVTVDDVPVGVHLRDPRWALAAPPAPARASVQLTGPLREIVRMRLTRPRIVVPVDDVRDSVLVTVLRTDWVHLRGGSARTRVEDVQPGSVRLSFIPLPASLSAAASPPVQAAPPDSAPVRPAARRDSAPARTALPPDTLPGRPAPEAR